MGDWKTLETFEIDAGGNNFIEVNLKQPPEGENTLVGISKGWKTPQEEKRYKANILFSPEKLDELIDILQKFKEK
ncbi:MAG: hypothetical protein VX028_01730 [Nanoarchaeota archaeon]|nr:hypothetical protein [Nanoarchaeota archaeon]